MDSEEMIGGTDYSGRLEFPVASSAAVRETYKTQDVNKSAGTRTEGRGTYKQLFDNNEDRRTGYLQAVV